MEKNIVGSHDSLIIVIRAIAFTLLLSGVMLLNVTPHFSLKKRDLNAVYLEVKCMYVHINVLYTRGLGIKTGKIGPPEN